ncbi:MAG: hypothetical protein Q7J29_00240 [Stagnimonas sp.]|nr:hypothetical protein [Stagnimonas sp.]
MNYKKLMVLFLGSCQLVLAQVNPLPSPSVEKATFNFAKAISTHLDSPSRFAEPLIKRVNAKTRGAWTQDGNLAVWTYAIEVPGAVSMGFYADDAFLPPSATVEVATEKAKAVYGANRFRSGTMLTSALEGSQLTVIVRMPAASKGMARFSIDRFNVGYKSLVPGGADHPLLAGLKAAYNAKKNPTKAQAGSGNSYDNSSCDRNFICERNSKPEITDPGQAIVGLTVFGVDFCTANLVNDASGSFTTFLATAAHCISYGDALPPNADGYIIRWSQETPCGTDLDFVRNDPSKETTGAVIRAMTGDALLLEATDAPPFGANPYWAGWTAENVVNFKGYPAYDPANPNASSEARFCDPSSPSYDPKTPYCEAIKEQVLFGIHHGRSHTKQYVETGTTANSNANSALTYTFQQTMPSYAGPDGKPKTGPTYQAWALKLRPMLTTGRIAAGASGSGLWYASKKQIIGTLSTSSDDTCPTNSSSTAGDTANYQRFREAYYGPASATSANAYKFWLDPSNTGISQRDGSYNAARAGSSTVSLTSTKASLNTGESVTLNWSTTKAGFCHLAGDELADHGVDPSGTETFTVSNTGDHTYNLSCRNDAQVVTDSSVTVAVSAPAAGTLSFVTSASTVFVGETVTLNWNSANTATCRAEGAWTGAKALSGSETVTPIQGDNRYIMICQGNNGGEVVITVPVTANPRVAPVLNFSTSSTFATQGTTVLLSWNSSNTDSCSATGDWAGAQSTSASANVTVSNVGTNTYNLTCTGAGGSTTKTVFVTGSAVPTPTPPTTPTNPGTGGGSSGGGSFGVGVFALGAGLLCRRRMRRSVALSTLMTGN